MGAQQVIIRLLCPELCEDWLHFFDNIAFKDHGEWAFCYCLEGHLDPETQEKWTNSRERREKVIELIKAGEMRGYLAYSGNTVIGWCNANDRKNYKYLTEMFRKIGYQTTEAADTKVKSIFCFLIAPEFQYHGTSKMYMQNGFSEVADLKYVKVLQKKLSCQ